MDEFGSKINDEDCKQVILSLARRLRASSRNLQVSLAIQHGLSKEEAEKLVSKAVRRVMVF